MLGPNTRHKLGKDQIPQPEPLVRRIKIKPLLRNRYVNLNRRSGRTELVGTRSRASRRRMSDNDIWCSASDRRWFPARPA